MRSTTDGSATRSGDSQTEASDAAALLAELTATVDAWLELDPDTLPSEAVGDLLVAVERQVGRLKAAALRLTTSFERRDGHRATGHRNVQHFLQDTLRQSAGQAKAQAETARMLEDTLEETSRAVRDGEISPEHATAIARAASKLDDDPNAEATLLAAARDGDANQVRRTGDRLSQRADAEAARRRARRSYEQRIASFRTGPDGSIFFEGRLHQLGGEKLLTAIDALCAPNGADDARSPGQRRADALVDLADLAMRDRRLPEDGGERPQLLAIVPLETIERRAGAPPGTLAWTGPTPPPALEELLCEADLDWLITDTRGLPLHLGRTRRFANRAQRRALRARDGGCRWPGCTGRAEWCVAHHVDFWDDGGLTDIDRLVLLCPSSHAMVHHGGWRLTLDADATVTIRSPDGAVVRTETAAQARARHLHATGLDEIGHPSTGASIDGDRPAPRRADAQDAPSGGSTTDLPLPLGSEDRAGYHVGRNPPRTRHRRRAPPRWRVRSTARRHCVCRLHMR